MAWLLLLAVLLALAWRPARADSSLLLTPERPQVDARPALRLLPDSSHELTLADVQRRQHEFAAPQSPATKLGLRRDAVWLYLPGRVQAGDGRWLLNIVYPKLHRVDLYPVSDGKLARQLQRGSDQPSAE